MAKETMKNIKEETTMAKFSPYSGAKFKIFHESFPYSSADTLNNWLSENPNVDILSYQYQHTEFGYNSICIAYVERTDNDHGKDL